MRRRSTATSRSRLEKLTVTQLVTSSPNFTEPEGSVSHYRAISCPHPEPDEPTPHLSIPTPSLSFITILTSTPGAHPFPTKILYAVHTHTCYLFRPSHPTWSNHHNTARRILKWISALWSFLQYRVTDNSRPTSHRPAVKCPRCQTPSFIHIQNIRENYGPVHFYLSVRR